jgi:hypothetical protein
MEPNEHASGEFDDDTGEATGTDNPAFRAAQWHDNLQGRQDQGAHREAGDLNTIGEDLPAFQIYAADIDTENRILTEEGRVADWVIPAAHQQTAGQEEAEGPQPPTGPQINCQHNWDLAAPGNPCKSCTLNCEDYAMVCTVCLVEACGECCQNFAANVQLNWPGAGEKHFGGGDEVGRDQEELDQPVDGNEIVASAGEW